MAAFASLPSEILILIMSNISYRDRARIALVSALCRNIADDDESYKIQYIRDFGDPSSHDSYTGMKTSEEVSWKIAYERRHFADMPLLVRDRLRRPCGA